MVMTKDYVIDNNKLEGILDEGEYDYIVVGSGCTALAFIQEVLRKNEHARILCLERGAWSPQPKVKDMRDFPKSMVDSTEKPEFWELARDQLHITGADKIGDSAYSGL
ncbi:2-keto-gluconate dehydrogenase [Colletotrichum kahawae]|uniref:2-keto-gluconate dehydrogenase n=1 Tax=Colletotrichum kahawae TaxID=34407 RepID=A0AAD9YFI6_COLKA|nr:2-keto-gluconate dehydrogenase [Colletotrichum kahawae]